MPRFQRDHSPKLIAAEATIGHPASFTRLYHDFFDPIYWYCCSRLGDATAAEDAASAIFTRALAAGPRYDDPALRSWLFTIAHNVVANAYRANRPQAPLEAIWDLPDPVSPLEEAVIADEERDRLLGALRRLPDDQRQVVDMRMAGLTGPEIAHVMRRSHGAIKSCNCAPSATCARCWLMRPTRGAAAMDERTMANALDRFLNKMGNDDDLGGTIDPETARIAHRYLALGQAPAPAGARERVQRRVTQGVERPRQNGLGPASDVPEPRLVFPAVPPAAPRDLPSMPGALRASPLPPARRQPIHAFLALLLVLAIAAATLALLQMPQRPEQLTTVPAIVIPTETPLTAAPSPQLPMDDQALVVVDLPAGSLPPKAFGATLDHRTMPPHSKATEVNAGPFLLRYVVSGHVTVKSTGSMRLMRTGGGAWEEVPAGDQRDLSHGDAIFLSDAASVTWGNTDAEPVEFIAWAMTDGGSGNSTAPKGWGIHNNAAVHMAPLEQPESPVRVRLRRIELAPGDELAPQPGAMLDQIVFLDVNAAGEKVAPMLGKMADGGRRNAGRQAITMYELIVESLDGSAGSPTS